MREQEVSFKIQATIDGQTEAGNKEAPRRIQEKNSTKKNPKTKHKAIGNKSGTRGTHEEQTQEQ